MVFIRTGGGRRSWGSGTCWPAPALMYSFTARPGELHGRITNNILPSKKTMFSSTLLVKYINVPLVPISS